MLLIKILNILAVYAAVGGLTALYVLTFCMDDESDDITNL